MHRILAPQSRIDVVDRLALIERGIDDLVVEPPDAVARKDGWCRAHEHSVLQWRGRRSLRRSRPKRNGIRIPLDSHGPPAGHRFAMPEDKLHRTTHDCALHKCPKSWMVRLRAPRQCGVSVTELDP